MEVVTKRLYTIAKGGQRCTNIYNIEQMFATLRGIAYYVISPVRYYPRFSQLCDFHRGLAGCITKHFCHAAHKHSTMQRKGRHRAALLIEGLHEPKTSEDVRTWSKNLQIDPDVVDRAEELGIFRRMPRAHNPVLSMSRWVQMQIEIAILEKERKLMAGKRTDKVQHEIPAGPVVLNRNGFYTLDAGICLGLTD